MNYYSLIILFAILVPIYADTQAQEECRKLHHEDIDPSGTNYTSYNCRLNCNVHGKIHVHNVNEGRTCLGSYVCQNGECRKDRRDFGHIDVEVISASFNEEANAYATVCISNNSMPVPLPLKDRKECISCSTQVQENTKYAQWNELCSSGNVFFSNARVTIETWNYYGTKNNVFLGGVTLTIEELINHDNNHRKINLAMTGGRYPGQLTTRITFTQCN